MQVDDGELMQSSLLADEDVDLVDSVAGLRQILSNITAGDDDVSNRACDVPPDDNVFSPSLDNKPPDTSGQSLDSRGEVNTSLDNRTLDVQPDDGSAITINGENMTETDEMSDEKLENTLEMETKCTDTNETMTDEDKKYSQAKDKTADEEHEGTSDKDIKSTDIDGVVLPLPETKEYSETEEMECDQESTEAREKEEVATDSSVNYETTTEMDEKSNENLKNTSEMEIEDTDTTGMMADEAKDQESDEENEDTLDNNMKSTGIDEVLLPVAEAEEYSETENVECGQESVETWEREVAVTDSSIVAMNCENMTEIDENSAAEQKNISDIETGYTDISGTIEDEAKDEKPDEEHEGVIDKDMKSTDNEEVLSPLAEAEEYLKTEDKECDKESSETGEMEMKCTDREAVVAEVEKCQELLDGDIERTSEMDGKWSETDAVMMMEEAIDESATATAGISPHADADDSGDDGHDGAEYHISSLAKISVDFENDEQVRRYVCVLL